MNLVKADDNTVPAQTDADGVARWVALKAEEVRVTFEGTDHFPEEEPPPRENPGSTTPNQPGAPVVSVDEFPLSEEGSDKAGLDASSVAIGRLKLPA
jgi:hypothetical protein